ncbi:MAG: nuclear transport factor 2 family protein [Pseudomonadota bacterium]
MAIEDNRQVALAFYARFDAGDVPGVLALMADDATFWIAGKPGTAPTAGPHTKAQIAEVFVRMTAALEGPLRMTVLGTVAEGDKVALEVRSHGQLRNGRVYEQEYHALMTVRGGRIAAVREYMDTEHVQAVWYRR